MTEAGNAAAVAGEIDMASICSFMLAIREGGRSDLMQQLYEVASIFSSMSVGEKPSKEVVIINNDVM